MISQSFNYLEKQWLQPTPSLTYASLTHPSLHEAIENKFKKASSKGKSSNQTSFQNPTLLFFFFLDQKRRKILNLSP